MEERNIVDKRYVRLEDMTKEGYIPFLAGRPKRETNISEEDILNLRISLNTAKSLEEFISLV